MKVNSITIGVSIWKFESLVIFKIILKREENENDAWELRWVFKALMLKGKYVISVYLRCMKGKSPSGKCQECKQITRPEFLLVYIFRFLYLPVGVREWLRDESRGRQVIFMSFAALYVNNFLPISKSCRCTGFSDLPHTFPLFSPEISKLESAVYSEQENFCLANQFCWMRKENNFFMKEDLIDILAPPTYIHGSGNRAAKPQYKIKNLSSSGSSL